MRRICIVLILFYKKFLSPLKGRPTCRFYPSCSTYAIRALEEWGLIRGGYMTAWRFLRCQPFARGGYDFVFPHKSRPDRISAQCIPSAHRIPFLPGESAPSDT